MFLLHFFMPEQDKYVTGEGFTDMLVKYTRTYMLLHLSRNLDCRYNASLTINKELLQTNLCCSDNYLFRCVFDTSFCNLYMMKYPEVPIYKKMLKQSIKKHTIILKLNYYVVQLSVANRKCHFNKINTWI